MDKTVTLPRMEIGYMFEMHTSIYAQNAKHDAINANR